MAFKSIVELSTRSRSRFMPDAIIYRTSSKNGKKKFFLSLPARKAKPAGLEPGMKVDVRFDPDNNHCQVVRTNTARGLVLREHTHPKNVPAYRYDLGAQIPDEANLPLAPDPVDIFDCKSVKDGIEFKLPVGGSNGKG